MNDPSHTPFRCGAETRSGVPCAKFPMEGKRRCRLLGALVQAPKRSQAEQLSQQQTPSTGATRTGARSRLKEKYYRGDQAGDARSEEAGLLAGK